MVFHLFSLANKELPKKENVGVSTQPARCIVPVEVLTKSEKLESKAQKSYRDKFDLKITALKSKFSLKKSSAFSSSGPKVKTIVTFLSFMLLARVRYSSRLKFASLLPPKPG